jgi:hypothetical protein
MFQLFTGVNWRGYMYTEAAPWPRLHGRHYGRALVPQSGKLARHRGILSAQYL